MNANRSWLDALTDGQIMRDWFSLIAQFALGITYFSFFIFAYAMSIGLSVILIGIPLLLFTLASTRAIAAMDQRLFAGILNRPAPEFADDVDVRGANLGERMGMYLGSLTTWRSLIYLGLKLPVGIAAIMAAICILPFLGFEMLLLGPMGIDLRLATPRLLHLIAVALHKFPGYLLPTGSIKRKRDFSRLETVETLDPAYYLDDDGELILRERA